MHERTSIANQQQSNHPALANHAVHSSPEQVDLGTELNERLPMQLKLSVGAVNDPLEHEADAMADKVMRMSETRFIQRKAAAHSPGDYDDEHVRLKPLVNQITPFIQAKGDGGGVVSDSVSNKIKSSMGGGSAMDTGTRSFMENRFGTDFGDVKIHNNAESGQLNRSLNAKAFTVSNNIYFNSGQYQPESGSGKHLLAHELTHVVQQNQGAFSPAKGGSSLVQRFESEEHQQLGDMATGNATYNLGSNSDRFELTHGDILALSGDVFMPDELFKLAATKGDNGTKINTRDEVLWALQDERIWEMRAKKDKRLPFAQQKDRRFEKGGAYGNYKYSDEVKDKVFEKYQKLAAANVGHFASPLGRDASGQAIPADNSAGGNYLKYHKEAIKKADSAGRSGGSVDMALAYDAAAQHFLTDAFSSGHLRTPVGLIRDYWSKKYPLFWYNLLHKLALDTAIQMTSWTPFTAHFGYVKILKQVMEMAPTLPAITLGDLISSVFHDYDNENGLKIKGGGKVYGDSHIDPATRTLAIAAIRASNEDIRKAYEVGKQTPNPFIFDEDLFTKVRSVSAGSGDKFAAQNQMPEPDSTEPPQNWKASDINQLWDQKFLGNEKETTGEVISRMMQGGSIAVNLKAIALKFPEWTFILRPRHSYLVGFVEKLQAKPKEGVLDIINWAPHGMDTGYAPRDTAADLEKKGDAGDQKENLRNMTAAQRVKFVRGLMSDGKTADQDMIVHVFNSAFVAERQQIYREIEGRQWTGDFDKKDKLYKTMRDKRILINLKYSINGI